MSIFSSPLLGHTPMSQFIKPMLLSGRKFNQSVSGFYDGWVYERKYDGVRCVIIKHRDRLELYTRNGRNITDNFPDLVEEFKKQKRDFVLDGEIVSDSLNTVISRIHPRLREIKPNKSVSIMLFDIMNLDGCSLINEPLVMRKLALKNIIQFNSKIRFVRDVQDEVDEIFGKACQKNWEGIVAKRVDGVYESKRTKNVIKIVNYSSRLFPILGFLPRKIENDMISSIIVGDSGINPRYKATVRMSSSPEKNKALMSELSQFPSQDSYLVPTRRRKSIQWVKPKKWALVSYLSISEGDRLRCAKFETAISI